MNNQQQDNQATLSPNVIPFQMTPQQAISIVDQVCSVALLNRSDQMKTLAALRILQNMVKSSEEKKD